MASFFVKKGNIIRLESKESSTTYDKLPVGHYLVQFHPDLGFYLEPVESGSLPKKIYGGHKKDADRVMQTFLSRPHSTGVLLVGEKGSGKTMLAHLISDSATKLEIPTLIINQPFTGDHFNNFLNEISQSCVVLFDEFEKVYDKEKQPMILTLMDGVFSGQKLYLLTANDKWKIDSHMRNRPGRLFYMLEYKGLEADFIREFCNDTLVNKQNIEGVCAIANLFQDFNFDMLQALIEEMNRYDETASDALRLLNCKPELDSKGNYLISLTPPVGKVIGQFTESWVGNPMVGSIQLQYGLGPKDSEGDYTSYPDTEFTIKDLISMDPDTGVLTMLNKAGFGLTLVKDLPKSFSFHDLPHAARMSALAL